MEELLLILLVSGVIFFIFYIISIVYKTFKKTNIFTFSTISLLIISLILISSSLFITIKNNNIENKNNARYNDEEQAPQEKIVENEEELTHETESATKKTNSPEVKVKEDTIDTVKEYIPGAKEYPISLDEYEDITKDADGTIFERITMITPDGIKAGFPMNGAVVAFPNEPFEIDGLYHYTAYTYFLRSFIAHELHEHHVTYKDLTSDIISYEIVSTNKSESYSGDDMSPYDFINMHLPVQEPDQLIKVPFLEGKWEKKEENLLKETNELVTIEFGEDGMISMENNLIPDSEVPILAQYKLEPLDTNAFKLYLYPANVKADSAGGGVTISEEPAKRNFLVYLTSDDTFNLVFYDERLDRQSISMDRVR